jgi:hypothetical protein
MIWIVLWRVAYAYDPELEGKRLPKTAFEVFFQSYFQRLSYNSCELETEILSRGFDPNWTFINEENEEQLVLKRDIDGCTEREPLIVLSCGEGAETHSSKYYSW